MEKSWKNREKVIKKSLKNDGKIVEKPWKNLGKFSKSHEKGIKYFILILAIDNILLSYYIFPHLIKVPNFIEH